MTCNSYESSPTYNKVAKCPSEECIPCDFNIKHCCWDSGGRCDVNIDLIYLKMSKETCTYENKTGKKPYSLASDTIYLFVMSYTCEEFIIYTYIDVCIYIYIHIYIYMYMYICI